MTQQRAPHSRRIVVGVDGSEESKTALAWAAVVAKATGADIEAVITWELPGQYDEPVYSDDWRPDLDATTTLEETLTEVFEDHRPPGLTAVALEGPARQVLLAKSAGAELLIVGSRGHGGFTGLLLGSVSTACAQHAHCAVLVAHGDRDSVPSLAMGRR